MAKATSRYNRTEPPQRPKPERGHSCITPEQYFEAATGCIQGALEALVEKGRGCPTCEANYEKYLAGLGK